MKRGISVAMVLFGFNMLVTGILNIFPPFDTVFFPSHVVNSIVFGVLAIIHVWLNWKQIIRYFQGLRWWWTLVGVGFLGVVWSVVIMPMFYITGVW
jgi:hypothetical protein